MNRTLLLLLILLLVAGPAFAGTLFRVENRDAGSDQAEISELTVAGKDLRMDTRGDTEVSMIYRGGSDEIVVIDHDEKSYSVLDRETVENMANMMNDAMRQMEAALANVPAEQRAMVEDMMKKQMGAMAGGSERPEAKVRETGKSDRVEGVSCAWKEITRDDEVDLEVCVSSWSDVPNGDDLANAFRGMQSFYSSMIEALSSAGGPMAALTSGLEDTVMSEMVLADGFPMITKDYEGGQLDRTSRFMGSEKVDTSAESFAPPSGYRRNEIAGNRR